MITPVPPTISDLVSETQAEGIPPDVLVVRGYLGPSEILEQADQVLERLNIMVGGTAFRIDTAAINGLLVHANAPWRIYLSARLNSYVAIDDWTASVVRVFVEVQDDREESHIVWLRRHYAAGHATKGGQPITYRVVTIEELVSASGFVAGQLVEDFMSRSESRNVVWDEQQYGPTTGKKTHTNCF